MQIFFVHGFEVEVTLLHAIIEDKDGPLDAKALLR